MAKAAMASADEGKFEQVKSWPQQAKGFYTDVRMEMKKVTVPSMKEVRATTAVVVITVFLFGVYFWLIDNAIGQGIDRLFRYFVHR